MVVGVAAVALLLTWALRRWSRRRGLVSRALRVASYNVHGCRGRDGRRDVGRIVRILREIDADVVGLQEVESRHGRSEIDQAEEFAAALGMTCIEGPLLHHAARLVRQRPAHAARGERGATGRVRQLWREARGAIVCDLRAHDGVCWRVMTTHLDLHSRHRRRQFETLLDELVPTTAPATVLMGDFNEWWPCSRALAELRRHAELPPTPPGLSRAGCRCCGWTASPFRPAAFGVGSAAI